MAQVQKEVDDVKEIMKDNIAVALDNQEKATELVDKTGLPNAHRQDEGTLQQEAHCVDGGQTEQLSTDAEMFKKQSKSLKKTMWWQDKKLLLIIIGIVGIIVLLLIIILCATLIPKNKNKDDEGSQ